MSGNKAMRRAAEVAPSEIGRPPLQIVTTTILITPQVAAEWLQGRTHQRALRDSVVDRYARVMKAGGWRLTHQGIAFDESGMLIDGQHRLWAIVLSGVSVWMMVHRGQPRSNALAFDSGETRRADDNVNISGVLGMDKITRKEGNCLRRMIQGMGRSRKISPEEEVRAWQEHNAAIRFALSCFPDSIARITTATTAAVLSRAYYHAPDRSELRRFGDVLVTGHDLAPYHRPAAALRAILVASGATERAFLPPHILYRKTETAVRAFLDKTGESSIMSATDELFPLPEEREAK